MKTVAPILLAFIFLLTPVALHAQVEITEIMYDLDGTDSGREWVEVKNISNESIDLADWSFYENGTNHGLSDAGDGLTIESGGFVIIADKVDKFKADHSGFSGTVIDSTFSLSNAGETLSVKDSDGDVVHEVTYSNDQADGNGYSLQWASGEWIQADPTPGTENATTPAVDGSRDDKPSTSNNDSDSSEEVPTFVMEPRDLPDNAPTHTDENETSYVSIDVSLKRKSGTGHIITAGVATRFVGTIETNDEDLTEDAEITWNFGNGDTAKKESVFYTYEHPGTYVTFFTVSNDDYTLSDKMTVTVVPAKAEIAAVEFGIDGFIKIVNHSDYSLDLSRWHLQAARDFFTLPEHTVLLPGVTMTIRNTTSKLNPTNSNVKLLYPGGAVAADLAGQEQSVADSSDTHSDSEDGIVLGTHTSSTTAQTADTNLPQDVTASRVSATAGGGDISEAILNPSVGSAGSAEDDSSSGGVTAWIIALFGFLSIAVGSVVFLNRHTPETDGDINDSNSSDPIESEADTIEIIE